MGNRAVITTEQMKIGIYLHWNGGRDNVEAFLQYCKDAKFRPPEQDNYGWARLCQVIANYFGEGGLSIGIDILENVDCDNQDNGTYIIKDWEIVERGFFNNEKEQTGHNMNELLKDIDFCQPVSCRIYNKIKEWRDEDGTHIRKCSGYYDETDHHHPCDMTVKGQNFSCENCKRKTRSVYNRKYYFRVKRPKRMKMKA